MNMVTFGVVKEYACNADHEVHDHEEVLGPGGMDADTLGACVAAGGHLADNKVVRLVTGVAGKGTDWLREMPFDCWLRSLDCRWVQDSSELGLYCVGAASDKTENMLLCPSRD